MTGNKFNSHMHYISHYSLHNIHTLLMKLVKGCKAYHEQILKNTLSSMLYVIAHKVSKPKMKPCNYKYISSS